ncbi:MAG: TonB-dependent receptor, partial [Tannerella sp.]|nr:TonB-dependent receptor [Tannerella sp.]
GKFAIPNLNPGDYRLALSFMGYKTLYIEVAGLTKNLALPDVLMEEEAVGLDAVTVTGSATTGRIDRKLIFPTERQVKASSNGIELLQKLMLPRLQVNPMTREVSIPGGGEVQLRINGVKAETNDIVALLPADIIRVEYHDNPGLRYGNAAAVIDYIVRRHESGGNLNINFSNSPQLKRFGNHDVSGKVNYKKSEFAVNGFVSQRDLYQLWRDNEETFHLPGGSAFQRREEGEPGHLQWLSSNLNMTYSYLNEQRMFSATFRYHTNNKPYEEYNSKLYSVANPDASVQMFDRDRSLSARPALDLYYQENLKHDQTLVLNAVGTGNYTDNSRVYTESRDGVLLTDIHNQVTGSKYSLIGEGIYEKQLGGNRLSAGVRHTQSFTDNTYRNGHEYRTEMQQGETFLYAEWKGKVQKLDYTLGAGGTRSSFRQEAGDIDYNTWTFNPRVALFLPLPENMSLRLTGNVRNSTPSLADLSAVEQAIDSLQVQRGNPGLKPYSAYHTELLWEWRKGLLNASVKGTYENKPSAIMEEKFWENGRIVRTWDNQKNWQWANALVNLRFGPVKEILTLSAFGGVNHFVSNGNSYRHVYNNPFFTLTANGSYRNFNAMFLWQKSWNHFEGETMSGGENLHMLQADYRYKTWKFGIGMFCPFADNYYTDRENRSAHASYKKRMYINETSRLLFFSLSWNMNFGRTSQSGQKRLNNADEDAGVMKTGK